MSCNCICHYPDETKAPILTIMDSDERRDVVVRWNNQTREFNVPTKESPQDRSSDYSWGYLGTGPTRLTRAILTHWTGGDREFVKRFTDEFLIEFVQPLPDKGGKIPAQRIDRWLQDAKTREPKPVDELLNRTRVLDQIRQRERMAAH